MGKYREISIAVYMSLFVILSSMVFIVGKEIYKRHTYSFNTVLKTDSFRVQYEQGVPAIYLSDKISQPNLYRDLVRYLNTLNEPNAKIYLAGNGGSVETTLEIIYTLQNSKTKFEMVVYGNVYSAHAMLAVSGDSITVFNPQTVFLFHIPAIYSGEEVVRPEISCESIPESNLDRGVSARQKCIDFALKTNEEFEKTVGLNIKAVLSDAQYIDYLKGNDVLVSYEDILLNKANKLNKRN